MKIITIDNILRADRRAKSLLISGSVSRMEHFDERRGKTVKHATSYALSLQ